MNRKGFTLVELLVVIAIIGLLAGLLLPAVSKVQAQAKSVKCAANLREAGTALSTYQTLYSSYPDKGLSGKRKFAFLVTIKRTGLSPKQCLCPANGSPNNLGDGNLLIANFTDPAVTGGLPIAGASGAGLIDYALRGTNIAIPADSVDPASTPIGADTLSTFHANSGNVLFGDGHVENVAESDTTWLNGTNAKGIDLSLIDLSGS